MGAWGTGTFDNDDASDWLYELEQDGVEAIRDALSRGVPGGYLEAPDACCVLAAAEVIAALAGHPAEALPAELTAFLATRPHLDPELVTAADAAIARVLGDDSELRDLWADSDHDAEWRALVADLRARLAAASPAG